MDYKIARKSDVNYGTVLTVQIPRADVDWCALYTLEADTPDFIVPFHYHLMDDVVEVVFLPEKRRMLRFYGGERNTAEYGALFTNLMLPLQNGGDWFLNAFCFVLDFDQVYYDDETQAISYLYLPVKEEFGTIDDIKMLISQVNSNFRVNNSALENKVLRAITDSNFRICDFVNIFRDFQPRKNTPVTNTYPEVTKPKQPIKEAKKPDEAVKVQTAEKTDNRVITPKTNILLDDDLDDELHISGFQSMDAEDDGAPDSSKKSLIHKLFGKKEEKQPKQKMEKESKRETKREPKKAGKKEESSHGYQVISGAAAESMFTAQNSGNISMAEQYESEDSTVVIPKYRAHANNVRLEYNGRGNLPSVIPVDMHGKSMFSIGRFDSVLNRKQSDFEFSTDTKEVSRRHAVIEKVGEDYYLIDIGSLAGTYVNDESIGLNNRVRLNDQDQVSFGRGGADYVFRR